MRHLLTLVFFLAAMVAYILSSVPGALALLLVGLVLESMGWYRIFHGRKRKHVPTH